MGITLLRGSILFTLLVTMMMYEQKHRISKFRERKMTSERRRRKKESFSLMENIKLYHLHATRRSRHFYPLL